MKRIALLLVAFLSLALSLTTGSTPALGGGPVVYTVNSTGDGQDADVFNSVCETAPGNGVCTFRAAIEQANATGDKDTIAFDIPNTDPDYSGFGTYEIEPLSALPVIGNPVIIDGRTQPEFVDRPVILLCGISAGALVDGLRITSGNTEVRGLVISRFGIVSGSDGIEIQGAGNNIIEGNYIGVNAAPSAAPLPDLPCGGDVPKVTGTETDPDNVPGNGDEWGNAGSGVFINGSPNNTIGGTSATSVGACTGACNILSGGGRGAAAFNDANGVEISGDGAIGNVVLGNHIGIDAGGGPEFGPFCADDIDSDSDNSINDGCPQAGATPEAGLQCANNLNNDAGDDALVNDGCPSIIAGPKDFGNKNDGVNIYAASNNTIGGTQPAARNTISTNDSAGLEISGGPEAGIACSSGVDNDNDLAVNDGCPQAGTAAESGGGCANAISDDDDNGDTVINGLDAVNDGCPGVKVASGNHVEGNFIGATPDGQNIPPPPASKPPHGVLIDGAPGNTIGGTTGTTEGGPCSGACNIVSGNSVGLQIQGAGATGNVVAGSYFGLNITGLLDMGNLSSGLVITSGASNNTVGGTAAGAGNVISGNNLHGLEINSGSTGNMVQGNFIGVNAPGSGELFNGQPGSAATGRGVRINVASGNTIGGSVAGRNVISGNVRYGVEIVGATAAANVVQSNYIGTSAAGSSAIGNWHGGLLVDGAPNTQIGGSTAGQGNVISGNGQASQIFVAQGVVILGTGAAGTKVEGNFIGTDSSGGGPVANLGIGLLIVGSPNNTVGGTAAAARNVISGNGIHGVEIDSVASTGNKVQGNYIGLDTNGGAAVGNGGDGIFISDSAGNTVGGTAGGAANVVSGNGSMGIEILGVASSSNLVQGNFIGTDSSGGVDLGNSQHGVFINGAPDNIVGGTGNGARNVIAGNGTGVFIQGGAATGNEVLGNFVGTNATGTVDVGNTFDGIRLGGSASNNVIGGPNPSDANVIAYNGGDGVVIDATGGSGNRIQRSTIFSNGGLGIDLFPNGVTANDVGDADTGPNNLQNYPDLTSANSTLSGTSITGTLNSSPNTMYSIYFFSDITCDPSGYGEGRTFIGSANITTDGTGNAGINLTVPGIAANGHVVNATATDPAGNTSEFSECQAATGIAQPALKQGDVDCDNIVNAVDALKVLRFGASLNVAQSEPCPDIGTVLTLAGVFGDIDCTGVVNAVDALKLLRYGAALSVQQNEPPPCTDVNSALP